MRTRSSFARKGAKFKTQPRVLVLCEDTKSSKRYFEDAKAHFRAYAEVQISHCGQTDPIGIVSEALGRSKVFERVYCAIDRDSHASFHQALQAAGANSKVTVIASYPCFEFWLRLHFGFTRAPYAPGGNDSAADRVIRDLKLQSGMAQYDKAREGVFAQLLNSLPQARTTSAQVLKAAIDEGNPNPSTQVHLLIAAFEQLSRPSPVSEDLGQT